MAHCEVSGIIDHKPAQSAAPAELHRTETAILDPNPAYRRSVVKGWSLSQRFELIEQETYGPGSKVRMSSAVKAGFGAGSRPEPEQEMLEGCARQIARYHRDPSRHSKKEWAVTLVKHFLNWVGFVLWT